MPASTEEIVLLETVTAISGTGSVPLDARVTVLDWITRPVAEIVMPLTVTGSESVDVPRWVTKTATFPVPLAAFHGVPLAPVQLVVPVDHVPSDVPERLQVSGAATAAPGRAKAIAATTSNEQVFTNRMASLRINILFTRGSMEVTGSPPPHRNLTWKFSGSRSRSAMPRGRRFVPPRARFVPFAPIRPSRHADSSQETAQTSVV